MLIEDEKTLCCYVSIDVFYEHCILFHFIIITILLYSAF